MARKEKVTRVIDGDTFETSRRKHPVRLANVDAPETGKPGGAAATKHLKGLIGGQEVTVDTKARDKYGRAIAGVKRGNQSVNKAMRDKLGPKKR